MKVFVCLLALVAVASAGLIHGHSSKLSKIGLSGIGYTGGLGLKSSGLSYGGLKSHGIGYGGDLGLSSLSLKHGAISSLKSHDIGYGGDIAYGTGLGLGLGSQAIAYSGDIGLSGHDIGYASGIGLKGHDLAYAGGLASYGGGYGYDAGISHGYGLNTIGAIGTHGGLVIDGAAGHSLQGAALSGHGIADLALTGSAGLGYAGGYASGYEDWC